MPSMAFRGTVTKVGVMKKTATVTVARQTVHPQVGKHLIKIKQILTHDPMDRCRLGDTVLIQQCRPISARKQFCLIDVLQRPSNDVEGLDRAKAMWKRMHRKPEILAFKVPRPVDVKEQNHPDLRKF